LKYATALSALIAPAVLAGGTATSARILEFEEKGDEEYRLVLVHTVRTPPPETIVLHLRHAPEKVGARRPAQISEDAYRQCVAQLRDHFDKRESFTLGQFGNGIQPIPGKEGEYQSNTLVEYGGVCYSFAGGV